MAPRSRPPSSSKMATPQALDASLLRPPRRRIPSTICSNWTTANGLLGGRGIAPQSPRRKSSLVTRIRAPIRALMGEEKIPVPSVRIVAVVGEGSVSPLKNASWEQVMLHTVSERCIRFDAVLIKKLYSFI